MFSISTQCFSASNQCFVDAGEKAEELVGDSQGEGSGAGAGEGVSFTEFASVKQSGLMGEIFAKLGATTREQERAALDAAVSSA